MRRFLPTPALALALILSTASAQQETAGEPPTFYVYQGRQLYLDLDPSSIAVRAAVGVTETDLIMSMAREGVRSIDPIGIAGWSFVRLGVPRENAARIAETIDRLLDLPTVDRASPVLLGRGDNWLIVSSDILLRFRAAYASEGETILKETAPDLGVVVRDFGRMQGAFKLRSSARNGFSVLARANSLAADHRVEWAEPDAIFTGQSTHIPNDPGFIFLWGIRNTGQTGGLADMDMDGDRAWDFVTGDASVKVAVIDNGVQQNHPDIQQVAGADMTGQAGGGAPVNRCDKHGTAVAGCVSATMDNGLGTVGIAPGCKVASVRTFVSVIGTPCSGNWTTTESWTVDALAWAESTGCKVTNNSNAYGFTLAAIDAKYQATYDSGMVHFAAAGNNGVGSIVYPASIGIVNSVAALNDSGNRWSSSNYGPGLDFSAPGVDIYTTDSTGTGGYVNGDYAWVSGTSFASPYAAGVAALTLSRFGWFTPADVEARMRRSCKDLGSPGYDTGFGWGFVNALRAVTTSVTFGVDMRVKMRDGTFRPDSGDAVTVQGSFNLWTNVDTLRDNDVDSVYTGSVPLTPFLGYMYRFWKTPRSGMGQETGDRLLSLDDPDTVLTAPYFNNEGPPAPPVFSVEPASLVFGPVNIDDSLSLSAWVYNTGTANLDITTIASDNAVFVNTPGNALIIPGDSAEVTVEFKPVAAVAVLGNLVFIHNAASSPDTVTLTGTGVAVGPSPKFLTVTPETLVAKDPVKGRLLKAVKRPKPGKPIPYPNWANLRDELIAQGGFAPGTSESDSAGGLRIGLAFMERRNPGDPAKPNWKPRKDSSSVHGWVRIGKWNFKKSVGASATAIPKTLENKTLRHTGPARGLDSTGNPGDLKRKLFVKEQKKLDPKRTSNRLFAELLALKFNIAASQLGKTPAGLGELIFDREGNPVDEVTVKGIAARVDTMLTYWAWYTQEEYDSVYSAIRDINRVFAGALDTVSFMAGSVLALSGSVELSGVPFLKAPVPFQPVLRQPTSMETEPEEEYEDEEWEEGEGVPAAAKLYGNYPNPFNPGTTLSFRLLENSLVTIRIYNTLGQQVAELVSGEEMEEGYNEASFSGAGLSSGVYFCRIEVQGLGDEALRSVLMNKMILLK